MVADRSSSTCRSIPLDPDPPAMDLVFYGIGGATMAAEHLRRENLLPPTVPAQVVDFLASYAKSIAVVSGGIGSVLLLNRLYEANPIARTKQLLGTFSSLEKSANVQVSSSINDYNSLYDKSGASEEERNSLYQNLVDSYYSLATQFYEWGWGRSFHFAYQTEGETFSSSIRRHEHYLASFLNVKPGDKVLDCGCGIGGPLMNIGRFTQGDMTGITINKHQVDRANTMIKENGMQSHARVVQGDFLNLPFADNTYDAVYAIEATCHAPRREDVFGEIFRVLKPGQYFACYEWGVTDKYDPSSPKDQQMAQDVMKGDGLPGLAHVKDITAAAVNVGFELKHARDLALDPYQQLSWYFPLSPSWNPFDFRFQLNPVGKFAIAVMLRTLEFLRLAPAGTCDVNNMLLVAQRGLVQGGADGTFTPMWLIVCRKPLSTSP